MAKGIKISQRGMDISKAADYQLVLDSSVPTPGIVLEGQGTIAEDTGLIKVGSHNLGFRPLVLFYVDTTATLTPNDNRWDIETNFLGRVSDQEVFFDTSSVNVYPTRYKFFVLNIPADVDFDAPTTNPESGVSNKPSEYGMKVVFPGHSVLENELENFSLNTDSKTLQIHAIRWGSGSKDDPFLLGSNVIRVRHNLGYPPFVLTTLETIASSGGPVGLLEFGFIQFGPQVTDTDAVATMIPDRKFGIIIFKDPLAPKEIQPIEVTYG